MKTATLLLMLSAASLLTAAGTRAAIAVSPATSALAAELLAAGLQVEADTGSSTVNTSLVHYTEATGGLAAQSLHVGPVPSSPQRTYVGDLTFERLSTPPAGFDLGLGDSLTVSYLGGQANNRARLGYESDATGMVDLSGNLSGTAAGTGYRLASTGDAVTGLQLFTQELGRPATFRWTYNGWVVVSSGQPTGEVLYQEASLPHMEIFQARDGAGFLPTYLFVMDYEGSPAGGFGDTLALVELDSARTIPIPEPGALALLGLATPMGILLLRRRR